MSVPLASGTCPFCSPEESRIFYRDDLVLGIWDGFPISNGHALLVPRRHIASWFEASAAERNALSEAITVARDEVLKFHLPEGFNIGINVGEVAGQTVMHLHVHVIPRYRGDVDDPRGGVRHVIPSKANYLAQSQGESVRSQSAVLTRLVTGGRRDPLLPRLTSLMATAAAADLAVAFVLPRGVERLLAHLEDLLAKGGRVRLVTGDYRDVTDPDALMRLLDLRGNIRMRVFETSGSSDAPFGTSFHPKAYLLHQGRSRGSAFVGSSNLSELALTDGVEWNYLVSSEAEPDGWRAVAEAFEQLWNDTSTVPLTSEWVDRYRVRRTPGAPSVPVASVPREDGEDATTIEPLEPVAPHSVQLDALAALDATREAGNKAGLVVLATGLGKTWLSAFDSSTRSEFRRVLFVAHREEILRQAQRTFRRVRPSARLGYYNGQGKDRAAEVLFASIQTLGRRAHLERFAPNEFDYIVVDEFHHASAATYRRLISYFSPRFLLGLTATPERTDGGDLLQLCDENLVYRCDLVEGIAAGLLSPFKYVGVPDDVDYANIPWRNAAFDEEALTEAVATVARAENALDQWRKYAGPGSRTMAFCVSQRHARFMAGFFREKGLRAVAVHSGADSAPRALSLEQLDRGALDIVCAVDMFNEGVDVPSLDTVLMLRPTESKILWLQQFGRGLRKSEGKSHLRVVDYIGNHRVFLLKPQTLFGLPAGRQPVYDLMVRAEQVGGVFELPDQCEVTYDLQAVDILKQLSRPSGVSSDALRRYYEDFKEAHGQRPTASEAHHDGYQPRSARPQFGSWFGLVRSMGDLPANLERAWTAGEEFLRELEVTPMTKSYKMVVLRAMLNADALPGRIRLGSLTEIVFDLVQRSALLTRDFGAAVGDHSELRSLLVKNPLNAWTGGWAQSGTRYFSIEGDEFVSTFTLPSDLREPFQTLARELVEWRLTDYLDRPHQGLAGAHEVACRVSHAGGTPMIFLPTGSERVRLPAGPATVWVEGKAYTAHFAKVAVNTLRSASDGPNELPAILRGWFGGDAGLPGTRHTVVFVRSGEEWHLARSTPREPKAVRWAQYSREQIPGLFGMQFSTAIWNVGYVRRNGHIFLLVTLEKEGLPSEFQYGDRFVSPDVLEWHSQNRTSRDSVDGRAIRSHREEGTPVHLFVRRAKRIPGGGSSPFYFCGDLSFEDWKSDRPITIRWRLEEAVPLRLRKQFGIDTPDA